eukprot:TRINITY_DN2552_c0_g2_i12.p1 TRINITY_DN2552_c0_g2~~TRINITY_DN2552_c0_g2_i12.p1  ORF type:complete len:253 (-),score=66.90 TRINITY_DN2552_c0_g2_i12:10-768(-)
MDRFLLCYFSGVRTQEELVQITAREFAKCALGCAMLKQDGDTPQSLFYQSYPELVFRHGRKAFHGYWSQAGNNYLLFKVMKEYDVRDVEGWYRLSNEQISESYGKMISKKYVIKLLEFWYPDEEWKGERFSEVMNRRCRQKFLGLKLRELFQKEMVLEEYLLKVPGRKCVILDFYYPGLGLVVEYQGEQHYYNIYKWVTMEEQMKRDEEKRSICLQNGYKIINVPFWWDGTSLQLKHILQEQLQSHNINYFL